MSQIVAAYWLCICNNLCLYVDVNGWLPVSLVTPTHSSTVPWRLPLFSNCAPITSATQNLSHSFSCLTSSKDLPWVSTFAVSHNLRIYFPLSRWPCLSSLPGETLCCASILYCAVLNPYIYGLWWLNIHFILLMTCRLTCWQMSLLSHPMWRSLEILKLWCCYLHWCNLGTIHLCDLIESAEWLWTLYVIISYYDSHENSPVLMYIHCAQFLDFLKLIYGSISTRLFYKGLRDWQCVRSVSGPRTLYQELTVMPTTGQKICACEVNTDTTEWVFLWPNSSEEYSSYVT